jgi:signal transduction histidine kinase
MSSPPKRPRIPWHVVYYLLAAFDVLTVCASLWLGRRVLDIYVRSVAENQEWARHTDEYAALQQTAALVNAPGNDVFASRDAPREEVRMREARARFATLMTALRAHVRDGHPADAPVLLPRLDAIEAALASMTKEEEATLGAFRSGDLPSAAERMAAMDRRYASLLLALQDLRRDVSVIQQRLFASQTAAALRLQRVELLILALVVVMVIAALLYGRRLEEEMGRDEATQRAMQRDLEARMDERTRALGASEEALRQAASEWRRTFDAIDSPVMVLDLRGRLLRANATVRALLGKGATDGVTGRIVTSLGEGEPWETASRLATAAGEAGAPRSAEAVDPESCRSWDVAAYLAQPGEGDAGRVIVVATETTRLLELRETLRREENMAAMGALVAGVAHEVRNPIFAISSTLDAFEARFGATPGLEKYFPVLRREVVRLGDLSRDLLDYGRPSQLRAAPCALRGVVEEAVRMCQEAAAAGRVTIANDVSEGLQPVVVDAQRMTQVFQNVIHNAVLHTPAGGRVTIAAHAQDGTIEAAVRDTGPGFRAEDIKNVFRPLFTRRAGGTGLGLSIAHRVVEMHGGTMSVANAPEGGALVTIRFPARPPAGAAPEDVRA